MFLFPPCLLWFVLPSSLPLQPRAMAGHPLWVLIPTPKLLPITELINMSKFSISSSKQLLLHVFIKRTMLFDSCHQLTGHEPAHQSLTIFHKFSVICSAIFHPTSAVLSFVCEDGKPNLLASQFFRLLFAKQTSPFCWSNTSHDHTTGLQNQVPVTHICSLKK